MLAQTIDVQDLGPAAIAQASAPVFAPDGRSVIYVQIATQQSQVTFRVMSRSLQTHADAFLFNVPNNSLLWTLNAHGGTLLLSIADTLTDRLHLEQYMASGASQVSYGTQCNCDDYSGAISPNGLRLAFVRTDYGSGPRQVMVRDATSGNSTPTTLLNLFSNESVSAIRWLDNDRILVSKTRDQTTPINVILDATHGGGSTVIGLGLSATADPTGRLVVFLQRSSQIANLWLTRLNASSPTQLTTSTTDKSSINWSADGTALVYTSTRPEPLLTTLQVLLLPPLSAAAPALRSGSSGQRSALIPLETMSPGRQKTTRVPFFERSAPDANFRRRSGKQRHA